MAVRFKFILDDVDAENVFFVLNEHVRNSRYIEIFEKGRTEAEIEWHKRHADYFEGVISKMLDGNCHVDDFDDKKEN